jgi:hypothetical protein
MQEHEGLKTLFDQIAKGLGRYTRVNLNEFTRFKTFNDQWKEIVDATSSTVFKTLAIASMLSSLSLFSDRWTLKILKYLIPTAYYIVFTVPGISLKNDLEEINKELPDLCVFANIVFGIFLLSTDKPMLGCGSLLASALGQLDKNSKIEQHLVFGMQCASSIMIGSWLERVLGIAFLVYYYPTQLLSLIEKFKSKEEK